MLESGIHSTTCQKCTYSPCPSKDAQDKVGKKESELDAKASFLVMTSFEMATLV